MSLRNISSGSLLRAAWVVLAAMGGFVGGAEYACAQQTHLAGPFQAAGDSFYENFNFGASLRGHGWFAQWGGAAPPPFGNFNPNADLHTGFAVQGKNFSGQFNFSAGQGFQRTMVSQTPGVSVMNGQSGLIADQLFTPFVMGVIPVVGDMSGYEAQGPAYGNVPWQQQYRAGAGDESSRPAPVNRRAEQHADRGRHDDQPLRLSGREKSTGSADRPAGGGVPLQSVAEIRAAQQAEATAERQQAEKYWQQGQEAEAAGKRGAARVFYQMAARRAAPPLRSQIEARLKSLDR